MITSPAIQREYGKVRRNQLQHMTEHWRRFGANDRGRFGYSSNVAKAALEVARTEVALQEAERDELIRFEWVNDDSFEIDGFYGYDEPEQTEATNELREKIQSGEWVADGCCVLVPKACPHCGKPLEGEWEDGPSLWGIVHAPGDEYVREVERDLFEEALG